MNTPHEVDVDVAPTGIAIKQRRLDMRSWEDHEANWALGIADPICAARPRHLIDNLWVAWHRCDMSLVEPREALDLAGSWPWHDITGIPRKRPQGGVCAKARVD